MTFVFYAALRYDSVIGGRTRQLAMLLAAEGHEVVFVEMPSLRSGLRFLRRTRRDGLSVVTPPPLPGGWRRVDTAPGNWWRSFCALLRRDGRQGGRAETVYVVSTPWWMPLLRNFSGETVIFDCLDHISVMTPPYARQKGEKLERELLERCAGISAVKQRLLDELRPEFPAKPGCVIPNGVHEEWIIRDFPAMALPAAPGKPRIGFIGALYEWVDQALLARAARELPDYEFIIAGPTRRGVNIDLLDAVPNIRRMDAIDFQQVPSFIAALDVALIPFHRDIVSDCADPLKLYEYTALGVPVVSTVAFNPEIPCAVGRDEAEFIGHIRRLAELPRERRRFPREAASAYTWRRQARKMAEFAGQLL